jgi:hypothetical protein
MGGAFRKHWREDMRIQFLSGNLQGIDHSEDVCGRILSKLILKK